MDSREVAVEFLVDGQLVGRKIADKVPAGANRLDNRILVKQPASLDCNRHEFKARITSAPGATVLDAVVQYQRFVR